VCALVRACLTFKSPRRRVVAWAFAEVKRCKSSRSAAEKTRFPNSFRNAPAIQRCRRVDSDSASSNATGTPGTLVSRPPHRNA